ncbi:hypothetical protein F5Y16DRAFT_58780 [Xylariaceae sp. FL0255]|nr:hypothetical protein F5Y16DRAFT_58780 [Xylariaceae sp. FL0255]
MPEWLPVFPVEPVTCEETPLITRITMDYFTQVLPIRYSSKRQLEKYLAEVLQTNDFVVTRYVNEEWTVQVRSLLDQSQINRLSALMRRHYYRK